MGTNNRQRRAAKARERARAKAGRGGAGRADERWFAAWDDPPPLTDTQRARVAIDQAVLRREQGDAAGTERAIVELLRHDAGIVTREFAGELRRAMPHLWNAGWQPAEIVRHGRRSSVRAGRVLAAAVLADHADRHPDTLDPRWAAQVAELASADPGGQRAAGSPGWLAALAERERLDRQPFTSAMVDALAAVRGVGRLPIVIPPPGRGAAADSARSASGHGGDDAVLAKVRALLAQAESTTFEAEADAFTAKAQDLMARHAIDAALVWASAGKDERPVTIRLGIDEPYANAKSLLLHVVAERSRCRAVYHPDYGLASVVGFASDVAATEVLFTSLLVQSQVALRAEAAAAPPGSRARSRSFRSSFLLAYARRIDERLAAVNRAVESDVGTTSLLPVLAARTDAIDDAVAQQFGQLRSGAIRGAADAAGWARGRAAADRAQLGAGDLDTDGKPSIAAGASP